MSTQPKIIVILGPTATGKSELAVRIALRLSSGQAQKKYGIKGAEIISADSRQVYRGVDLGSDKVPRDRCQVSGVRCQEKDGYFYKGIRHHLIDAVSPKRTFTVAQYKKMAEKAIREITKRGRIPIVAGGTGLYIDALTNDWKLPAVKPNSKLRAELEKKSAEELFARLKKLDPKRAKDIDHFNKRRLVRALEIVIQTGKSSHSNILSFSYVQDKQNVRMSKYDVLKIGIGVPMEELKDRIKKRTLKRLRGGMIQEMEGLKKAGVGQKRLDDISLYYRWLEPYLRGGISQREAVDLISTKIGQYAKRQMTWFKRDKNTKWISKNSEAEGLAKQFIRK